MKRPLVLILLVLLLVNGLLAFYYFFRLRPSQDRQIREDIKKEVSFLCPVPVEYCDSGRVVEIDGAYLGVGYQVPEGTPVLAVISGRATNYGKNYLPSVGGGHYSGIKLVGNDSNLTIDYVRVSDPFTILADYDQGEEIITVKAGEIANFGVNLLVRVSDNQGILELEPVDFRR